MIKNKYKIFFHLPHYPLWPDGLSKYQSKVYEYFKNNYEYVYIFGNKIEIKKSKFKIIDSIFKLIHIYAIIISLLQIFKIPRYSIIIITNSAFFHHIIPLSINKIYKKHKYLLIVHDLIQKERPTYLRRVLENYFIKNCNKVICNSKSTKNDLIDRKLVANNIEYIYPGLDVCSKKIPSEKMFPSKIKLLFVGSVEKRKGLIYLIESLKNISNDFILNIIGVIKSPSYYDELLNKTNKLDLNDKVHFRGRVNSNELINYYLNSTLFVFPTLYEGYGMAAAEAMAYGLPVISTQIPAIEEFVENGHEGFLVQPKNVEQLNDKIRYVINNPDILKVLSKNALLKSKNFPTWNDSSKKISSIVDNVFLS